MQIRETHAMFDFTYQKNSGEIKAAATRKIASLREAITKREERIARIREEHGIDDRALVGLLEDALRQGRSLGHLTYSSTSKAPSGEDRMEEKEIPISTVNGLLAERDQVNADTSTIKRLDRVVRNLKPLLKHADNGDAYYDDAFHLSTEEIDALGF